MLRRRRPPPAVATGEEPSPGPGLELLGRLYDYRKRQGGGGLPAPLVGDGCEPGTGNPMLEYLVARAEHYAASGTRRALLWLARTCWAEGHIEGYGRALAAHSSKTAGQRPLAGPDGHA